MTVAPRGTRSASRGASDSRSVPAETMAGIGSADGPISAFRHKDHDSPAAGAVRPPRAPPARPARPRGCRPPRPPPARAPGPGCSRRSRARRGTPAARAVRRSLRLSPTITAPRRRGAQPIEDGHEVRRVRLLRGHGVAAQDRAEAVGHGQTLQQELGRALRLVGADAEAAALGRQRVQRLERAGIEARVAAGLLDVAVERSGCRARRACPGRASPPAALKPRSTKALAPSPIIPAHALERGGGQALGLHQLAGGRGAGRPPCRRACRRGRRRRPRGRTSGVGSGLSGRAKSVWSAAS